MNDTPVEWKYQKQKSRQLQQDLILLRATVWLHSSPSLQVLRLEPVVWQNGGYHATTPRLYQVGSSMPTRAQRYMKAKTWLIVWGSYYTCVHHHPWERRNPKYTLMSYGLSPHISRSL
jgi:hypothetical protein